MTCPHIVWLRRDLRLADNPALYEAAKLGPIIVVYVLDDEAAGHHAYGGASRWWLHHSLANLATGLESLGSRLILRRGDAVAHLTEIADAAGAPAIHANRHYEPWWRKAQARIKELGELNLYDANYLMPPGAVLNGSGNPYKIYTPFSKATLALLPPRDCVPAPERIVLPDVLPESDSLDDWGLLPSKPDWAGGMREAWSVGEQAAHDQLQWWIDHVDDYDDKRNFPSLQKVSRLSPHLHFGEISPVQIWQRLKDKSSQGWKIFEKELIWRDYAQNAICQFPAYASENYRDEFDRLNWRNPEDDPQAAADLKAWQRGQTGYPIVDAGMRELWRTGWMHNRVRMITASFLIKHLLIDWRHGEKWFWDTLVDADYASNATNWQWTAGSGVDSNMFVRIMAPLSQSEKFDSAQYIRTFVPELAMLDEPYIHDPEEFGRLPTGYPAKIVPHRAARERALAAYKEMKGD